MSNVSTTSWLMFAVAGSGAALALLVLARFATTLLRRDPVAARYKDAMGGAPRAPQEPPSTSRELGRFSNVAEVVESVERRRSYALQMMRRLRAYDVNEPEALRATARRLGIPIDAGVEALEHGTNLLQKRDLLIDLDVSFAGTALASREELATLSSFPDVVLAEACRSQLGLRLAACLLLILPPSRALLLLSDLEPAYATRLLGTLVRDAAQFSGDTVSETLGILRPLASARAFGFGFELTVDHLARMHRGAPDKGKALIADTLQATDWGRRLADHLGGGRVTVDRTVVDMVEETAALARS